MFLKDEKQVPVILDALNLFSNASGLSVNRNKSEIIPVHSLDINQIEGIEVKNSVRYLGILISKSPTDRIVDIFSQRIQKSSAGRYTGSYRIPVFIFLTIFIFKIPQYRCHLNNVRNATLLERGLFSLLHFGEDTAVCVAKRESSETEALVECDER